MRTMIFGGSYSEAIEYKEAFGLKNAVVIDGSLSLRGLRCEDDIEVLLVRKYLENINWQELKDELQIRRCFGCRITVRVEE